MRKLSIVSKIEGEYRLSDKNLIKIKEENPGKAFSKLIVDVDIDSLDISFIQKVLNGSRCFCSNYKDILYLNKLAEEGMINISETILVDDLEMKDRSYIDFAQFKKFKLTIPDNYFMWGVKNVDNSSRFTQREIDEATRIALMVSQFPEKLTDVEKIILFVNYIQNNCEYLGYKTDKLFKTGEMFELKDNMEDKRDAIKKLCHLGYNMVGSTAGEPLFENYAVCEGFSLLMMLFLNNPYIRIRGEHVKGYNPNFISYSGHAWNVILLNGKFYNLDLTRSITYSPYRAKNNLKTTKFNKEYILVGTDFLEKERHEKRTSELLLPFEESREDFDRNYIDAAIEHLKSTGLVKFEYDNDSMYYREASKLKR